MFHGLVGLNELYLDNNKVNFYQPYVPFEFRQRLINNRQYYLNHTMFAAMESLRLVDLHNNLIGKEINWKLIGIGYANKEVEGYWVLRDECKTLNLANNSIKDFMWFYDYNKLEYIDLRFNQIETLSFFTTEEYYKPYSVVGAGNITFDLKHNNMTELFIKHYSENYQKILLDHNPLTCDRWPFHRIFKAWKENKIQLDFGDQTCRESDFFHGRFIKDLAVKELSENFTSACVLGCDCKMLIDENILIMNCSGRDLVKRKEEFYKIASFLDSHNFEKFDLIFDSNKLTTLPNVSSVKKTNPFEILAANNEIFDLLPTNFHDSLEVLDVRKNQLTKMDPSLFEQLGTVGKVFLSGNPWICDCSTVKFLEFVHQYNENIVDYDDLRCSDQKLFKDLQAVDICFSSAYIITAAGATLGLLGTAFALFFKYQKNIKIWLYAHNMCMWFVSEEELDEDKVYDAFVVFASLDQPIIEDLVLGLEKGRNAYKLCVGIRDWAPGNLFSKLVNFLNFFKSFHSNYSS